MENEETPRKKISYGRWKLDDNYPFFSHLAYQLKIIECKNAEQEMYMPTVSVDKTGVLKYNPEYVKQLSKDELIFTMAHEVLHISLSHHFVQEKLLNKVKLDYADDVKKQNYEMKRLLYAADYVVNGILNDEGIAFDKDKYLYDDRFRGMSLEDVYFYLKEQDDDDQINPPQEMSLKEMLEQMEECDCDDGGCGDCIPMPIPRDYLADDFDEENENLGDVSDDADEIRDYWEQKMVEAYEYSKDRGDTPGSMTEMIENLHKEEVNWKTYLRKEVRAYCKNKYNTIKPSRRGIVHGYHLPSIEGDEISVVVALDTSGSMTQEQLRDALSEIRGILNVSNNTKMTVLMHDTEIHKEIEIDGRTSRYGLMHDDRFEVVGRGGTSHIPIFKWVEENRYKMDTDILVCFTDAWSRFPDREPTGLKTIWVINSEKEPPFGDVIWMND